MESESIAPVKKGMLVDILRVSGKEKSSFNAMSNFNRVIIIGEGIPEIFEPSEDTPALELGIIRFGGNAHKHFRPAGEKRHCMFGGDFVYTSDSRFTALFGGPMKIHDRIER